jgi:hypothetical protein
MSFISSSVSTHAIELAPSRFPAWLWLIALIAGLLAVLSAGLAPGWQGAGLLLMGWVASLEWRTRRQPVSLLVVDDGLICALNNGRILQAQRPLRGMSCPGWISVALPAGHWRRRQWVAIYRDQLGADDFRRLCIMMRD